MIFLLVFLIELTSLYFCSKFLIRALARLFYHLTKNHRATVNILAFLFLPGTLIHELAHLLTAGALLVPVGALELMPEIREDGVKLGSVEIGKTDLFRRAVVGVAPVLFGVTTIVGVLYFLTTRENIDLWIWIFLFYILFESSNTMFSSKKDLEGTLEFSAVIIGLFVALYLLKFNEVFAWFGQVISQNDYLIYKSDLFLLVPIVLDILVYILAKLMLGRRFRG